MLEAPQGEQPGHASESSFTPSVLNFDSDAHSDSGLAGRIEGNMPVSHATEFAACTFFKPGWVPGAPPQGEQPERVGSLPSVSTGNSTQQAASLQQQQEQREQQEQQQQQLQQQRQ